MSTKTHIWSPFNCWITGRQTCHKSHGSRHQIKDNWWHPMQVPTKYQRLVRQLIYLLNIKPDISYSCQQLSQHMSHPTDLHYNATLLSATPSLDAYLFQEAINDEMDSLESSRTWHLVDLYLGCKSIGCKWVLKNKLKPDKIIDNYKALLVAKGFRQRENIDVLDNFSPVTRITSIRVLISIVVIYNLIVHQMDVKTTFL